MTKQATQDIAAILLVIVFIALIYFLFVRPIMNKLNSDNKNPGFDYGPPLKSGLPNAPLAKGTLNQIIDRYEYIWGLPTSGPSTTDGIPDTTQEQAQSMGSNYMAPFGSHASNAMPGNPYFEQSNFAGQEGSGAGLGVNLLAPNSGFPINLN